MTATPDKDTSVDPVSKTDAPTTGIVDTIKRRHASTSNTQRETDIEQAEAEGGWTPTEKEATRDKSQSVPRDSSGIHPEGVVDESMRYMPRG